MTPVAFFGGLSHIPGENAIGFTRDLGCGERKAWERREETDTPGLRLLHLIQSYFVETCISPCQGPGRLPFAHEGVTLDKPLPGLFDATQSPVPSIVFCAPQPRAGDPRRALRHAGNFGTYRLGPHPRIHDNWSPAARGSLTTQYPYVEGPMERNLDTYAQVC